MVHYVDFKTIIHFAITQGSFDQAINVVKIQCVCLCNLLIFKLEQRFPNHVLMNALKIIYSHYGLQLDCEFDFVNHLALVEQHYCNFRKVGTKGNLSHFQKIFWIYRAIFSNCP
jgi:hypothetical protein